MHVSMSQVIKLYVKIYHEKVKFFPMNLKKNTCTNKFVNRGVKCATDWTQIWFGSWDKRIAMDKENKIIKKQIDSLANFIYLGINMILFLLSVYHTLIAALAKETSLFVTYKSPYIERFQNLRFILLSILKILDQLH